MVRLKDLFIGYNTFNDAIEIKCLTFINAQVVTLELSVTCIIISSI